MNYRVHEHRYQELVVALGSENAIYNFQTGSGQHAQ